MFLQFLKRKYGQRMCMFFATRHKETLWDFADALREYGFIDAIYITVVPIMSSIATKAEFATTSVNHLSSHKRNERGLFRGWYLENSSFLNKYKLWLILKLSKSC